MRLNKISWKDKKIFNRYLSLRWPELAVYSFENIYIWKGLYDIFWVIIEGSLCVFFKDKLGCFLYLAPLGVGVKYEAVDAAFKIMDSFNKNSEISRIENIGESEIGFYEGLGYECRFKSRDYLCDRVELGQLKGNKFKSQRACYNYFIKNNHSQYLKFSLKDKSACLKLYNYWMAEKAKKNQDRVFQGMMSDSLKVLKVLLKEYPRLDLAGRVVKIGGQIKAFSFGFQLNTETYCILYEVTDFKYKGLAQFIFCEFCREVKKYKYINIMDDSGLKNLEQVKLSYHPIRLIPAYIATRKNG